MYRFQLKITYQPKHQEDLKLNEKLIDAKTEMREMSELSDKDFEAALIKMLQQKIVNMLETNKKQKVLANIRHKKEPNGNNVT